ncbi:MAG: alpha/beta hydrolase [Steroidobacteraceae bacterium]
MDSFRKPLIGVLALVALLLVGGWLTLTLGWLEIPLSKLETKYTTPDSRWMDIDGIRVHYYDQLPEGVDNPAVIVLSHASFMSLRSWDSLAAALLREGYRVIRMDYLNAGLTGFDTKGINDMGRNVLILDELPGRLGVSRYHLVGTSSGGQIAFIHAGAHPERVDRFVLINSGGMPRTPQSNPNRGRDSAIRQWITQRYRSLSQWEQDLGRNIPSLRPLPADFVEMVYDMNRRAGGRPAAAEYLKNFRTGDTAEYLSKVRAPTMILQGMANPTLVHTEAELQSYWMTGAPTFIKKYPKYGHYPYIESPAEVEADVLRFLSGGHDAELKQTVRAPWLPQPADPPESDRPTDRPTEGPA